MLVTLLLVLCAGFYPRSLSIRLSHSVIRASKQTSKTETPIIILHGLLGSSRNFQSFGSILHEKMQRKHDICVMDLRNHGRTFSQKGGLNISYHDMAMDVIETLNLLRIRRCHLIGHSMGGKVASLIGLMSQNDCSHPEIKSLTLLDICPAAYKEIDFTDVLETVDFLSSTESAVSMAQSKSEVAKIVDDCSADPGLRGFLMSNIQQSPNNRFSWKFSVRNIHDGRLRIAGFDELHVEGGIYSAYIPQVLILKAGRSNFVRLKYLEEAKKMFPNFILVSERDCGHWLHIEKPQEVTDKIVTFIGQFS